MIQTFPLVWGRVAALASTHRSASTSYPGVPINLSSSLPWLRAWPRTPKRDFLLRQKARIHSCWTSPSYLPRSPAGGTSRESHHCTLPSCLPAAYDGFAGRGQDGGDRRLPPRHQRQSRRRLRTEETMGCPELKVCHGAKHPIPKLPASLLSQSPVPGMVPHGLLEAHILQRACLQREPAGRSCIILVFMKRFRKRHQPLEKRWF